MERGDCGVAQALRKRGGTAGNGDLNERGCGGKQGEEQKNERSEGGRPQRPFPFTLASLGPLVRDIKPSLFSAALARARDFLSASRASLSACLRAFSSEFIARTQILPPFPLFVLAKKTGVEPLGTMPRMCPRDFGGARPQTLHLSFSNIKILPIFPKRGF